MSYSDKLAQAISLIEAYNAEVEKEDQIDTNSFTKKLKKLGGTTESLLSGCSFEDIEQCGIPKILARKIATIFRTEPKTQLGDGDILSEKQVTKLAPLYLIQRYSLSDPDSHVAKRLKDLSKGLRFLVVENGIINAQESLRNLEEIRKGYAERDTVVVNGHPIKLMKIGDRKKEMADENPIYIGRPLRPDGTCDQLNRSWSGVSTVVRQIIYLAINDTRELSVSHTAAHDVMDKALLPDAEKSFRGRYAKASVRLDELTEEGKAPLLKIAVGESTSSGKNDPFHQNKTY
jgi:hypothetical protein